MQRGIHEPLDGEGNVYVTGSSVSSDRDYLTVKYDRASGLQLWEQRYLGLVTLVDQSVGAILECLERFGLSDSFALSYNRGERMLGVSRDDYGPFISPYTDPKMWWGTRPDTSGPIYKPERWEESDKIEPSVDRIMEADLLVTAVSLVDGIVQDRKREWRLSRAFDVIRLFEGAVPGRIVNDEDLGLVSCQGRPSASTSLISIFGP